MATLPAFIKSTAPKSQKPSLATLSAVNQKMTKIAGGGAMRSHQTEGSPGRSLEFCLENERQRISVIRAWHQSDKESQTKIWWASERNRCRNTR